MTLKENFAKTGNWLFRWRSYLPLLLIVLFILALQEFKYLHASHSLDRLWEMMCLAISLSGLGIRILTIGCVPFGTSGRNIKYQAADVLNTTGMYSIVRHPLYLGNFIIWLGLSLFLRLWWFSALIILIFWLYYERIIFAEEMFLEERFGEKFLQWSQKTPAFIPKLRNWQKPALPFSLRTVLRREYSSFFAIIVSFTVLEILGDRIVQGRWTFDSVWMVIFGVSLLIYLIIRILKKRTNLLQVKGR